MGTGTVLAAFSFFKTVLSADTEPGYCIAWELSLGLTIFVSFSSLFIVGNITKLSILSCAVLIPSVALAFAPTGEPLTVTSTALSASSFETEKGAIDPVGFFDPIGLTNDIDDAKFNQYRAGEIKNGRVAMLVVIGYIVPEFFRFPGDLAPGVAFADTHVVILVAHQRSHNLR